MKRYRICAIGDVDVPEAVKEAYCKCIVECEPPEKVGISLSGSFHVVEAPSPYLKGVKLFRDITLKDI